MANHRMMQNELSICHVNCQSLYSHFDEFTEFFRRGKYHVICMSETWLRPEISDAIVRLPGYSLIRNDKIDRIGGGVGIYVHSSLV